MSNTDDPAAVIRLHAIFDNGGIEKFRSAAMWNWGIPNGITLQLFSSIDTISSLADVVAAIENFETFLVISFGDIWLNCTLVFRQECKKHTVAILPAKYVQYVFERVCTKMYNKLREQMSPDQLEFGLFWVEKFMLELANADMNIISELQWEGQLRLREKMNKVASTPSVTKSKPDMIVSRKDDQLCFPFLRMLLGTNDIGCNTRECPRIHDEVLQWKKAEVREVLKAVHGTADMITALEVSTQFRN